MIENRIDEAAIAGFNSFTTGARMPSWIAQDELLASAWGCGLRQAKEKSRKEKLKTLTK